MGGLRLLAVALCTIAVPAAAAEVTTSKWAVLPARSDAPPPRDPTLLRLSNEIGEAIDEITKATVVVVSREMRDDACPAFDGQCPRDVASMLSAQRVVSLFLRSDYSTLEIRLYGSGLERSGTIPCRWAEGLVSCEHGKIREIFTRPKEAPAPEPKSTAKGQKKGAAAKSAAAAKPTSKAKLDEAWKKLGTRLERCRKEGWGATTERPKAVEIQFRVNDQGRATEVRLSPRGLDDVPAFSCMARAIESLRLPVGAPSEAPVRYPLPLP